jgi:argininosuccinate lyase
MSDDKYLYAYSVDAVNALVMKGMPFRDAYVEIGRQIANGEYSSLVPEQRVASSEWHTGSIKRPGLEILRARLGDCRNTRP